ncbi:unnamed protein product [Heligmosomoides polygyrus]|uniref:Secreted protein n=1 Tax=Heligmosomoides polygyrus TaxID=6339 RepID=A0A183GLJ4_HELPZ|nr:unnamed protein product [Heligmosomoides polygyrus]
MSPYLLGVMWRVSASLVLLAVLTYATEVEENVYDVPEEEYTEALTLLGIGPEAQHIYAKRGTMPSVCTFKKRTGTGRHARRFSSASPIKH